jgi:hypothetical protein
MAHYLSEIDELMAQAERLPDGSAKVACIERAVQVADVHNDIAAGFRVRVRLLGVALSAGMSDLLLVAFSWCLSQQERDPAQFPENDILWQFRWVISELVEFSAVAKTQVEELFADMERRYRRAGSSMRPYFVLRRMVAMDMGDREGAIAAHEQLTRCPRDWLSDGPDAETAFLVDFQIFTGRESEATERGLTFLSNRQGSEHYQGFLRAKLLLPLLKQSRDAQAMDAHLTGYRQVARNPRYVPRLSEHLIFLALTDNYPRGFRLFERHLGDALASVSGYSRMMFHHAACVFLTRIAERGRAVLRMRLPKAFVRYSEAGTYDTAELAAWFGERAAHDARVFDTRNGNGFYTTMVTCWRELEKGAHPIPIPKIG